MLKILERPIIKRFNETDWEFINPESYDNEIVADEFWKAAEILEKMQLWDWNSIIDNKVRFTKSVMITNP